MLLDKFISFDQLLDKETNKFLPDSNPIWKFACLNHLEISKKLKYFQPCKDLTASTLAIEYENDIYENLNQLTSSSIKEKQKYINTFFNT